MLFSEIYSAYYNAVAGIISLVLDGRADEKGIKEIVDEKAFSESFLTVLPALKSGRWQLIKPDMTTALSRTPSMPLTNIEKAWLKAVSLDPRIRLFDIDFSFLGETEPFFTPDDFVIYDKYSDGDDYESEQYKAVFRTILCAFKEEKMLLIEYEKVSGKRMTVRSFPKSLEYSEKDDKFRLAASGGLYINVGRIRSCKITDGKKPEDTGNDNIRYKTVTLKVSERRNTLERCLLHFAHFEKTAEKTEEGYILNIKYRTEDETEMVMRVLSFGPLVEAVAPDSFRNLIIKRLKRQKSCGLF
ncbi:MAG: WYL domain-containing protein [Clostridia bacterium]|nr:WYL domain-containing protein [Clostridia bacterium]